MNKKHCVALLTAAAVLAIGGCVVRTEVGPPDSDAPVIITEAVPPPPVVDQYYFWGGHYYYWHPDRHAYVIFNGHPPPERIVTVHDLPHRR